ncbi:MAG: alpha/beta hydrolase [Bacteroidaceae bacterium]|nr:alpha/beta hydrolase [Bacteroidaceae bacterium]
MKKFLSISIMLFSATLFAQKPIEIKVWPNGAPNSNGITTAEKQIDESRVSDVTVPTLTIYRAAKPNGMAIVACPGGGYVRLATAHEGHDMAAWFNAQGITYAVLKYRMPNTHHDVPLSDALQAIRIMKQHAEEWGYNKVGIMGSSAGGHLASTAATHFTEDSRPDFQILFYPVVSMVNPTHQGSKDNLLGKTPSQEMLNLYSNEKQVTPQTPPAFIMHSSDDKAVPVSNSIDYYTALVKNGVSASLHIYPIGGHGWGFRDNFIYKRQWTGELEKWLREINK